MSRDVLLARLRGAKSNLSMVAGSSSYTDDISYKSLYEDVVSITEFMLSNEKEIPDYELSIFLEGIVLPCDGLRDSKRDRTERQRRLDSLKILIEDKKAFFRELYGFGKTDDRIEPNGNEKTTNEEQIQDLNASMAYANGEVKPPQPMVYESETDRLLKKIRSVEELVDVMPIKYNGNSARFDDMHFGEEENELYFLVGAWSNKAVQFTRERLDNIQTSSFNYCRKYLDNAIIMLTLMERVLSAKDEVTMKRYAGILKNGLDDMEKFFGDQAASKQIG